MEVLNTAGFIVAAIVGGIIIMGAFFAIMEWIGGAGSSNAVLMPNSAFLIEGSGVGLTLRCGDRLEALRFLGFTSDIQYDSKMPYELSKLAAFDTDRGTRVRTADRIVLIEQLHPPRLANDLNTWISSTRTYRSTGPQPRVPSANRASFV